MNNKTCGECKHLDREWDFCRKCGLRWMREEQMSCDDFEAIQPPTNGDVIRQMSNEELVAFFITRDASYCVPDACLGDCEASKDCDDHWLRWLNAPAESEGENEKTY